MKTGDAAMHRGFESHPLRQFENLKSRHFDGSFFVPYRPQPPSPREGDREAVVGVAKVGRSFSQDCIGEGRKDVIPVKIAFFDSGMGGLSVLHHARRVLPHEQFIFYADETHVPYGTKPRAEVEQFVAEAFEFLLAQDVKAIVVACNTATSVAVPAMRARYDLPIIGMEPAAKKALALDAAHRVLVTATPITVAGEKMAHLIERVDHEHLVDRLALPELVTFAERMEFESPAVDAYLRKELAPYDLSEYSALVLGCTHFNYFKPAFRKILPPAMRFVDGNEGTVAQLIRKLKECGALASEGEQTVEYFYSGERVTDAKELERIAAYNRQLDLVYDF